MIDEVVHMASVCMHAYGLRVYSLPVDSPSPLPPPPHPIKTSIKFVIVSCIFVDSFFDQNSKADRNSVDERKLIHFLCVSLSQV